MPYFLPKLGMMHKLSSAAVAICALRVMIDSFLVFLCEYMSIDATKHVFGVFDKERLKPVSSATETSQKIENLLQR